MASCLPYSFCVSSIKPPLKRYIHQGVQLVRAQSFSDEGRSSNIVDANLSVLREKIQVVKMKERLQRRCCKGETGWNYVSGYDYKHKRDREISHLFELLRVVCTTLGFTSLACTLCLCLVSFFLHSIQL
ncbi:uncharacterized protein LOC133859444 [Alnus glutinosa]|uniref:uncharacterized protein LOC133859444 n=1 Tax=Alnus glutinosa TaxID=3517 RepID=UPI002D7724BD|nr:uncharacterized protein LOC133859444 [Alnus glutinosa]